MAQVIGGRFTLKKNISFFPGVVNGFFKYQKPSYMGHSFPASELLLKH